MILYRGPSLFDEEDIFVVMTGTKTKTQNKKTGPIPQVWVLQESAPPVETVQEINGDYSVCGDCVFASGQGCYVQVGRAPSRVWEAYRRGVYASVEWSSLPSMLEKHRTVRLGAYGDPAAVPLGVWDAVADAMPPGGCPIGFTHAWRHCDPGYASYCMASVETPEDAAHAREMGWRYMRVRKGVDSPLYPNEFICPATPEGGLKRTCETCRACDGKWRGERRANPTIVAHGNRANRARESVEE